MMEKNTVLLGLKEYDNFRRIEKKYYQLKQDLDDCLTKFDKNGTIISNALCGFAYIPDSHPTKIKIDLTKLSKVLGIEKCEIEIVKEAINNE